MSTSRILAVIIMIFVITTGLSACNKSGSISGSGEGSGSGQVTGK